jgi:hypothetical protein
MHATNNINYEFVPGAPNEFGMPFLTFFEDFSQ